MKDYTVATDYGPMMVSRPDWYPDWLFDHEHWFILGGFLAVPVLIISVIRVIRG